MSLRKTMIAMSIAGALVGCNSDDNFSVNEPSVGNFAPIATDVKINKGNKVFLGETVEGTYTFRDPNVAARPEGQSMYSWHLETAQAGRTVIEGADERELKLDHSFDIPGAMLAFCVQPVAASGGNSVGEKAYCSELSVIEEPIGGRPELGNPDNLTTQAVDEQGNPVTGDLHVGHSVSISQYEFSSGIEGSSIHTLKAHSVTRSEQAPIVVEQKLGTGENPASFELKAKDTEGKMVEVCVKPISVGELAGEEHCSPISGVVQVRNNDTAPVIESVSINKDKAIANIEITGAYEFVDANGDADAGSEMVWKIGADKTATGTKYTPQAIDSGKTLDLCVTPKAATGSNEGVVETCLDAPLTIEVDNTPAPDLAKPTVDNMAPAVGSVITASYTFVDTAINPDDYQVNAVWMRGDQEVLACTTAQNCEYTVSEDDLVVVDNAVVPLTYCATPISIGGLEGTEQCSDNVLPKGLVFEGSLSYNSEISITPVGYASDVAFNWFLYEGNPHSFTGSSSATPNHTGLTMKLGVNLIPNPWDIEAELKEHPFVPATGESADSFVAKSLAVCIDGTETCFYPSLSENVTGGLYANATDLTQRLIEPTRLVTPKTHTVYHRPLTVVEVEHAELGLLAKPEGLAYTATTIGGVEWALFNHTNGSEDFAENSQIRQVCQNLQTSLNNEDSTTWYVPVGATYSDTSYNHDRYAQLISGDGATKWKSDPMTVFLRTQTNSPASVEAYKPYSQHLFDYKHGWMVGKDAQVDDKGIKYASASTNIKNDNANMWGMPIWFNGSTGQTPPPSEDQFVSCVAELSVLR